MPVKSPLFMRPSPPTRLLITGGPSAGKTTLAAKLGKRINAEHRNTDALIELGWSEASQKASEWMDEPGPWIIEGAAVPRALRKWMARNPGQRLDGMMLLMSLASYEPLNRGQTSMLKGLLTVWHEIKKEALSRGLRFHSGWPRELERKVT